MNMWCKFFDMQINFNAIIYRVSLKIIDSFSYMRSNKFMNILNVEKL